MEFCGAKTARGSFCKIPRNKCFFHQKRKIAKKRVPRKFLYNSRGKRICGVLTTGHSQGGLPCRHLIKKGRNYCVYHSYLISENEEKVEVASILVEFSKSDFNS